MNTVPASHCVGGRLTSDNTHPTKKVNMSDKGLYLEMMDELIGVSAHTEHRCHFTPTAMNIAAAGERYASSDDDRRAIEATLHSTKKMVTLQNFFDREKHDSKQHQNSFASDGLDCEEDENHSDDYEDDDHDEFYEDDQDTVSSMLQQFKSHYTSFSSMEMVPASSNDGEDNNKINSTLNNSNGSDMDTYDPMFMYHSPRKDKYNHKGMMMDSKHLDMLSTSVHTSDGTEVTATETDYSLNTASWHSSPSQHHHSPVSRRSPQRQHGFRYITNPTEMPPPPKVYTINEDDSMNYNAVEQVDIPDIFSLQTRRLLGEGYFGKVYLVSVTSNEDSSDNCYALKKISKYHLLCEDQVHTIMREKQILQICCHPNIATLYDTKQDVSSVYLLQAYIPGGDLFNMIHFYNKNSGSVAKDEHHHSILSDERNVQFYVACITDALWYLHCGYHSSSVTNTTNQSIVYRDLKQENIMINERGYPILIDFGYAKILQGDSDGNECDVVSATQTRTYTMCGTAKYVSPEIIEGIGHTCSTDYWSLGIVTYELLTYGRDHPFEFFANMDDVSLYRSIVEAEYLPLPDEISAEGTDFVDQLLSKDSSARLGATESRTSNPLLLHPWLRKWDVSLLRQQSYPAPWLPPLQNSMNSSANPGENNIDDIVNDNDDDECSLEFDLDRQSDPNLNMKEQAMFAGF